MSDFETLTWSIDRDPRLRSPMVAMVVLDSPIDRAELRHRADRVSRVIPRFRQRVVADPYGIAPPAWETDPDFSLSFHLRTTDLAGRGTRCDLHQLAAAMASAPFDRSRPLWEFLYVEGMADSSAALITKLHHAISDGVGSVQLSFELFDLAPVPDPERKNLPPAPEAPANPMPTAERIRAAVEFEAATATRQLRSMVDSLTGTSSQPLEAAGRFGAALGGLAQMIRTTKIEHTPLLSARSLDIEMDAITVPLESLKLAGQRVGASVNDAFVSALLLGLRHYHAAHDRLDITTARVAIPINRRSASDDSTENNWSPSRVDLPIDIADPDELMTRVRSEVLRLRDDPTSDLIAPLVSVLRRLPAQVAASAFTAVASGVDLAASNVPGAPFPIYFLGRQVLEAVPFGPLSGAAVNITMLSTNNMVSIGIVRDIAAIPDADQFVACISQGFLEVIAG